MSKIYILHENEEWTAHLTKRLEELHIPYECWHLDHGSIDLTKEPPQGVFYNRMSASSHTRDHRFAHNRAGKGQGVQLFHSIQALEEYVYGENFEEPVDGITLVQQYVDAPKPFIIRHEFVGGKFLYAVKVDTSEGFELCPADACSIEDQYCPTGAESEGGAKFEILTEYHDPIIEYYEQFLYANSIEVAGIESIQDQHGQVYTYDVNTNTNYNTDAEQEANIYGMLQLANYLGNQLYRVAPHQAS